MAQSFLGDSRADIEGNRYDIDIVRTRNKDDIPVYKYSESKYVYYNEYYLYGDDDRDGELYYEFEDIKRKYPNSKDTDAIKQYLLSIGASNLFSCGGPVYDAPSPGLYIDEIGYIGFPLGEEQAKRIISKSKMAPFGRKEETIFDKNVRHTWEMEPSQFIIKNSKWKSTMNSLVNHVCRKLRYKSNMIEHSLYKLLIYEPGSFFKPHRDTEKEQGMFGTLVVILPSTYSGGQLIIRHCDREYEYDFSNSEDSLETNFAAFYADCEHEIKPVITGYRICLIYNLIDEGTKIPPDIKHYATLLEQIIDATRNWIVNAYTCPALLIYGLEHRYTNQQLSFNRLKGKDVVMAQVLKKVSESIPLDIALVNIKRGLIFGDSERTTILQCISEKDIQLPIPKNYFIYHDNMVQADFWKDKLEDEEVNISTGNEGSVPALFYHHTGIIFWPKQIRHHRYLRGNVTDMSTSIEYLNNLEYGSMDELEDELDEERNLQEAVLILLWKLETNSEDYIIDEKDMFDLYSILIRCNYRDKTMDLVDNIIRRYRAEKLIPHALKLCGEFPNISTFPSFRVLVGKIIKQLEEKRRIEDMKTIVKFRKLLDVNVDFA